MLESFFGRLIPVFCTIFAKIWNVFRATLEKKKNKKLFPNSINCFCLFKTFANCQNAFRLDFFNFRPKLNLICNCRARKRFTFDMRNIIILSGGFPLSDHKTLRLWTLPVPHSTQLFFSFSFQNETLVSRYK